MHSSKAFNNPWCNSLAARPDTDPIDKDSLLSRNAQLQWRAWGVFGVSVLSIPVAMIFLRDAIGQFTRRGFGSPTQIDVPLDLLSTANSWLVYALALFMTLAVGLWYIDFGPHRRRNAIVAAWIALLIGVVGWNSKVNYNERPLHLRASPLERDLAKGNLQPAVFYLQERLAADKLGVSGVGVANFELKGDLYESAALASVLALNERTAAQYVLAQIGLQDKNQKSFVQRYGAPLLADVDGYFYTRALYNSINPDNWATKIGGLGAVPLSNLRSTVLQDIDTSLNTTPLGALATQPQAKLGSELGENVFATVTLVFGLAVGTLATLLAMLGWTMMKRSSTVKSYLADRE